MAALDRAWVSVSLERLAAADAKVFGAEGHRFRLNPPLGEGRVAVFETQHGVRLPTDYRAFVSEVADGGAGPFYGVFPLGLWDGRGDGLEPWVENEGLVGSLSTPFPHAAAWNDLSGMPSGASDTPEWERQYLAFQARYWDSALVNGAMPICHEGCAYRIWLVVTGPEAGHLWSDGRAGDAGLAPVLRCDGARATFESWYREWLEKELAGLPSRNNWMASVGRAWRRLTSG